MIDLYTPNKLKVRVPESINEDDTLRFKISDDLEKAKKYYNENGYVVFSSVVSQEICKELRSLGRKR